MAHNKACKLITIFIGTIVQLYNSTIVLLYNSTTVRSGKMVAFCRNPFSALVGTAVKISTFWRKSGFGRMTPRKVEKVLKSGSTDRLMESPARPKLARGATRLDWEPVQSVF